MSVLYIRDQKGNIIPIPAIKGEKGDAYVLTVQDKKEIAEQIKAPEATGLSGEVNIESLPVGISYAEEAATLTYVNDAEMWTYGSYSIPAGAAVIKTVFRAPADNGYNEMLEGCMTVYILLPDGRTDRICCEIDMYGVHYDVRNGYNTVNSYNYDYDDPDTTVLTVSALESYLSQRGM